MTRSRRSMWVLLGILCAASALFGTLAEEKTSTLTVQGEVLDLACYIGHGAQGAEHAKCAQSCLKSGQPMGLLTKDGKLYVLFANHDDAAPYGEAKNHGGKSVEITGVASERAGVRGLEVRAVKAL